MQDVMNAVSKLGLSNEFLNIAYHIALVFVGYFVSMLVSYVRFGQELSYIKGQLSNILNLQENTASLLQKSAIIEKDISKLSINLDHAIMRIELLEQS
jgi:hypothetical protein